MLKDKEVYRTLPSQTAQQILRLLDTMWKSFFNCCKVWRKTPEKFKGRPKPPNYKKKHGEFLVIFTNQQCRIKEGFLYFPSRVGLPPVKTRIKEGVHQVRLIPKGSYYILEIVYGKEETNLNLNEKRVIGIDLGLNNIVTIVNNAGLKPAIIKGGVVKSINQFYNKELAKYKRYKDTQGLSFETKRLRRLTRKRNNKIHDLFHKISRRIVNYCIEHNFGTVIIGYNHMWKHKITLGKKTNQNFVQLPFYKLIHQLIYKSHLVGISVRLESEFYTSRCSFFDGEPVAKHKRYAGRRVSRGLFKTKEGLLINADVNAGYNILKKALPNAISADGIEGVGFHPFPMSFHERNCILE